MPNERHPMTPLIEDISRVAVIVFYAVAFFMALNAHWHTRLWARRASTAAMMIASGAWLFFYLVLANDDLTIAPTIVLESRVAHYVTATALFVMAYLIRKADREGIDIMLSRGSNGGIPGE